MNLGAAQRTINIGGTGTYNFGGAIAGTSTGTGLAITSSVALATSGTIVLKGAGSNTYSGSTEVNSGILRLNKTSGAVAIPGALKINGGSVSFVAATQNQIAVAADVVMTDGLLNNTTAFNMGNVSTQETISSLTMSGSSGFITGSSIVVDPVSVWTITNSFNITGEMGARFAASSGSTTTVGSLSLTGMSATAENIVGRANSFTLYGDSPAQRTVFTVGSGGLALNGSVINMRRSTDNAYALGSQLVLNGNLTTSGSTASEIKYDEASARDYGTISVDLSSSTGSHTRTITTAGGGADLTISVEIGKGAATTAGITKLGPGTLTLAGNHSYNGATIVSEGKLSIVNKVLNSIPISGTINASSGVTINGGNLNYNSDTALTAPITFTSGTISGTGTINTPVTVGTGAKLSPGNSPGNQEYSAGLTWSNGGTYTWEVKSWSATPTAGTDFDQIQVTAGGLNISGLSAGGFTIDINGLNLGNEIDAVPGFNNAVSRSWTILTANSLTGTFNPNLFTLATTNFATDNAGGSFYLTNSGNNLVLNYTPTTPTTYTLGATPTTLNLLKGGTLPATSTITNTGLAANNADTLNYTGLSATTGDMTVATVSGSSNGGPLANNSVGSATQNLVITGVDNGSTTISSSVASATNVTPNNAASLSGSAGTINVNVGLASFDSVNSSGPTGPALTALTAISVTPYTDLSSTTTAGTQSGTLVPALGTTATIFNYTNSTGIDNQVSMAWRSRTADEASNISGLNDHGNKVNGYLLSDVVDLTGMVNNGNASGFTDQFILQMNYNVALLDGHETAGVNHGNIYIVYRDGLNWFKATDGNSATGGTYYANEAYNAHPRVLGDYGIDPINHVVWAVLDHNSEFAVIPEPSTLVLGGLALLGFAGVGLRKRRLDS